MIPPKMIASDLDGTFFGKNHQPTLENIVAAKKAAQLGIQLVFATGRPARWLDGLDALKPEHPRIVSSNGAVIYDLQTERVLHSKLLPRETTLDFTEELREAMPGVTLAMEYQYGWAHTPGYQPSVSDLVRPLLISDNVAEMFDYAPVVKILAIHPDLDTHTMANIAFPISDGRLNGVFSMMLDAGLLEWTALGVSKASALEIILDETGISADEMVAFGDMPNDLEMLELAGHPYVMANAHPTLLEMGYPVAGLNTESGYAHTLTKILPIDLG